MSFGARFGPPLRPLALLAGLLLGAAPALAQTETPGTWTDPPVRGAAGPKTPESEPSKQKAETGKAVPAQAKPSESASGPATDAPSASGRRPASAARPAHRSAKLRREHIRVAARSRVVAEAPLRRPRYGRVARVRENTPPRHDAQRRYGERRLYAYRAYRSVPPRYTRRYATRDEPLYDGETALPPYAARRAGWGGLVADGPERRIAQARAAGYIVMRSRSYLYPDGTRVRELSPYAPSGLE